MRMSHSTTLYRHSVQSRFPVAYIDSNFQWSNAVCTFNSGAFSRRHLLENIGLLGSRNMFYGLEKKNLKRIFDAGWEVLEKCKQRQRFLPSQEKEMKIISESYIPDAFGLNKAHEILQYPQKKRIKLYGGPSWSLFQMQMLLIWFMTGFRFIICI